MCSPARADRDTLRRTAVIGHGSNAKSSTLTRKYVARGVREPAVIPVTEALLDDYDAVWCRISRDDAV